MKLNLGCGNKPLEGYVNMDIRDNPGVDVVRDILRGLPFSDNSLDEIVSTDFLEHIPQSEVIFVMNEMWRVLKSGASMRHSIPVAGTMNFNQDPTHLSHWIPETFYYFTLDHPKNNYYGGAIKPWVVQKCEILPPMNHSMDVILQKP